MIQNTLYSACLILCGCIWERDLGELQPLDASVPPGRAELVAFASRLQGTWEGWAGAPETRVRIEFRLDQSYTAECLGSTDDIVSPCPYRAIDQGGSYALTGIELGGAASARTVDRYCGELLTVTSTLNYMELSGDDTLRFVQVAETQGDLEQVLQDNPSCAFKFVGDLGGTYVELKRQLP